MTLEGKSQPKFLTARFNPHHAGKQLATAVENTIRGWDLRSSRYVTSPGEEGNLVAAWYGDVHSLGKTHDDEPLVSLR